MVDRLLNYLDSDGNRALELSDDIIDILENQPKDLVIDLYDGCKKNHLVFNKEIYEPLTESDCDAIIGDKTNSIEQKFIAAMTKFKYVYPTTTSGINMLISRLLS